MKTRSIKQSVTFNAKPGEVYQLIMDPKKHAAFTGGKVVMSNKANGRFNMFGDYIHGYNIELIEGKKIVQAWHFKEDGWPEDHFSTCTFLFEKAGDKTKLSFLQSEVPEGSAASLKEGWKEFYWKPMKVYLNDQ